MVWLCWVMQRILQWEAMQDSMAAPGQRRGHQQQQRSQQQHCRLQQAQGRAAVAQSPAAQNAMVWVFLTLRQHHQR